MTSDAALQRLLDGNARFVLGKRHDFNGADLVARRAALSAGQSPFAVIVSCSDSRVPSELLFDVGLGDIFVVRTAGHVVDAVALGSIEFAVEHLGAQLILVLGHQSCGAVTAAVSQADEKGNIPHLLKAIAPAVQATKGKPGDAVDNAVRANALAAAEHIKTSSPIISPRLRSGSLKVLAARYDLDSGKIELLT